VDVAYRGRNPTQQDAFHAQEILCLAHAKSGKSKNQDLMSCSSLKERDEIVKRSDNFKTTFKATYLPRTKTETVVATTIAIVNFSTHEQRQTTVGATTFAIVRV
jgi:hypothetical protein